MEEGSFEKFEEEVCKKRGKKKCKVTNSWGVYDIYKHIRKSGWYNLGRPITEHEFYSVVRGINRIYAEALSKGESIAFPHSMGHLELRESKRGVSIVDGKVKVNYPVNWSETLKLWYEDAEARRNKTLIRNESKSVYSVKYNKYDASYANRSFYEFVLNRFIKKALKKNIENRQINILW